MCLCVCLLLLLEIECECVCARINDCVYLFKFFYVSCCSDSPFDFGDLCIFDV